MHVHALVMNKPRFARALRLLGALSASAVMVLSVTPAARADARPYSAQPVPAHRYAQDPRWVFGSVVVDAPPDEVWARFQHVESWPRMLSDIARMRVIDHRGAHWSIELETRTLGHGMLGYDVTASPERVIELATDRLGVHAMAYTRIHPGPTSTTSLVSYSLVLDVKGLPSVLISKSSLREKQDHMVAVTLADIRRTFGEPPAPSR
jgi:hypothetical protein